MEKIPNVPNQNVTNEGHNSITINTNVINTKINNDIIEENQSSVILDSLQDEHRIETSNQENTLFYNEKHSSSPTYSDKDLEGDLTFLQGLKEKYTSNPSIGYLNINSLRGDKFPQLQEICKSTNIDILCIDETKLTPDIRTSKLFIEGYPYTPSRRD